METIAEEPSANRSDPEPVVDFDTAETDETTTEPSTEQSFAGKRIFVSHKCDVDLDEEIAAKLYNDLVDLGCEVYLDKAQPIGILFEDAIDDSLRRADFVIALLTRGANDSDWVTSELKYARQLLKEQGRPVIIPVKIGSFELRRAIDAVLFGINLHSYGPSEYAEILADIKAGILNDAKLRKRNILALEGFRFGEFQRSLTRAAFIDSHKFRRAGEDLKKEKLFWVVGDSGVRNHFARVLATKEFDQTVSTNRNSHPVIYEIPGSFNWSRVAETLVHDSIIIFPDVNPSALSDENQGKELDGLRSLAEQNLVIVTASKESYDEIQQNMHNRDLKGGAHIIVGHDFYDEQTKLKIFEQLLDVLSELHNITQGQQKWARRLLEDPEDREVFKRIIKQWSPLDIERFIRAHLRQARRPGDVLKLLQRNADLDNEIHSWFISLNDSTRCFVLVLAMLSGLRKEALWENYKLIIQRLRKLDPHLSLWPLGICRQRADPYVTNEGHLDFVDERIAETIYREITSNFREYLIELVPLIKDLSVPPGREQKMTKEVFEARKENVAETKEIRIALARIIGKAARAGLEGFSDLLEVWGADPALQVREAVAISLEHAVAERIGARQSLDLLQRWCTASNPNDTPFRVWAAASALGSIVAAKPGRDVRVRALDLLERLAGSNYRNVKFFISIALKKTPRKIPLVDEEAPVSLELLLRLVASEEKAPTKINVAEALIESRIADEAVALSVIRSWLSGDNADCRWAAMCSLILWRKQTRKQANEEPNREVTNFLSVDPEMTANVLVEILNNKHPKMPVFWESFRQLVLTANDTTRRALVWGLASQSQSSLEAVLMPLLRASAEPMLKELVVAVRAEKWERMFSTPLDFISDLHEEVHQGHLAGEIHAALAQLLKPGPEGRRAELTQALVSCFVERRTTLEEILTRLTMIAPTVFEPFSIEVRSEALRSLFQTPEILLPAIGEGLRDPKIAGETSVTLERLTRPAPTGHREEILNVLASVQAYNPASVRALLRQFRSMNSTALSSFTYQFNLRLLTNDLTDPERFIAHVSDAVINDPLEHAEVINILRLLSMPAPQGRRRALVQALGIASLTDSATVNMLLFDSSWQTRSGLLSLSMEVKLFSFLSRIISPKFTSQIFGLDN